MLDIRLTSDIEERLQRLTVKTGHSINYYVREAVLDFLEDVEDTNLALERLKNPSYCSLEELEAELGLDS